MYGFFHATKFTSTNENAPSITQIYGIGLFTANQLCDQLGLRANIAVKNMSAAQFDQLARVMSHYHITGQELERLISQDITRFVKIGVYKGFSFYTRFTCAWTTNSHKCKKHEKKEKPTSLKCMFYKY